MNGLIAHYPSIGAVLFCFDKWCAVKSFISAIPLAGWPPSVSAALFRGAA